MRADGRTKVAIVGTAETWKDAPWHDLGVAIAGLNDAYTLGFPRVDEWWDLHPLDHFHYRPKHKRMVYAEDVPDGYYVRPEGHLEQLKAMARTMPVWLQSDPPKGWPVNARKFDRAAAQQLFLGMEDEPYWASGPSMMVAQAILDGVEEIQVYGIHLATEEEYRRQRPNFEHILGIARGRGIRVVMAKGSPVMRHPWVYGYQPKPAPHPAEMLIKKARHIKGQIVTSLAGRSWRESKRADQDRLLRVAALEQDCQRALAFATPITIQGQVFVGTV